MGVTRREPDARGARPKRAELALVVLLTFEAAAASSPVPLERLHRSPQDEVRTLEALGFREEPGRILRREAEAGNTWARGPLLAWLVRDGQAAEAARLYESWGGPPSSGIETPWLAQGIIDSRRAEWGSAADAFVKAIETEPLFADLAAERAAIALENAGRADEALGLAELAGDLARNPELAARARWRAATRSFAQGEAQRSLDNLAKIPERSPIARRDQLELEAKSRRALGDTAGERDALWRAIEAVPSSEVAVRAVERLLEKGASAEERLSFAEVGIASRHPVLAEREARAVLDSVAVSPDPVLEGRARLLLGRALVRREKLSTARDELALLPAGAASGDRAEAALERARCLWKLDRLDAALAEYDSLAGSGAPEATRATAAWEAAREIKDARRWKEAAERLGRFAAAFPAHEFTDDAHWHRARALLEVGDVSGALRADSLLAASAPDSPFRDESSFWVARALADRGRTEDACARLQSLATAQPDGYWTLRARPLASSLGCALPASTASSPDSAELAGHAAADSMVARSDEMQRAAVLARWGFTDDAERETAQLRRRMYDDRAALLAIGRASARLGVPRGGMQSTAALRSAAGGSVLGGTFSSDAARLLYPVAYVDDVLRWCDEYGVDPFFVYAVMREESWFDAQAVSPAGARGLLQIMPPTGADLARQAGVSPFRRSDLFDPPVNIRLGVFYIARLLERLGGEPTLALAAYNAGERNAERWKYEEGGAVDVDRTVAGITYRETYDYVQRVSVTREIYRTLYEVEWPKLRALRDATQRTN